MGHQGDQMCFLPSCRYHIILIGDLSFCYCLCQESRPALTEKDIQRGTKKKEVDERRKQYIGEKGYTVIEMWESEWFPPNSTKLMYL